MPTGRSPGLTDQQHRALTTRGASVALSAGAGCGKTFVLIERFLAELEPADSATRARLGQLVAITFTERAAREMRDRVRAACHQRLLGCRPEHADYWLELLRDIDSARISTIHSFCGSLLRSHAVEAGVDPRFRVLDAAAANTLLYELIDQVLRQRLADRDEPVLGLVTQFGLAQLRVMITRLLSARQDIDWPAWQRETPETLAARWHEFWRCDTVPRVLRKVRDSALTQAILDIATRYPPSHPVMRQRCDFLRQALPELGAPCAETSDLSVQLAAIREAAKVQGGGNAKHWASEEVYAAFRDAAKALREAIDGVAAQIEFDPVASQSAAETALHALGLAAAVATDYDERKQELAVLDFDDLLIRARHLLTDPSHRQLRRRLAAGIHLLLVDEFQDTDPLQVQLVKSLCDDEYLRGKLFLVGDHKQSIYRFRGAQPHVFRQLRKEVPEDGQLPLTLNFRSQPAVLEFVNALFADEFGADYEPLEAHRPQTGPTPAVEFLWACETLAEPASASDVNTSSPLEASDKGNGRPSTEQLRRQEADWIARRIRAMLDSGEKIVCENGEARTARPGDVALLFRALTNVEYYEEALRRYGIDYYLVGGHAFYAQQEIYDLLNLLRAVNSPCDEVALAGVLRSPMFGLLDESLLWLSQPDGLAAGLFDSEPPPFLDAQQRQQYLYAAATLRSLRAMKDRMPVAQLIHEAIERTGYDAMLLAEFLGERKLANLHKLIEQARSFDAAGIFSLSDFITQLSQFVAQQPDEALAATHPESDAAVKLMSIHQSKGLEFPVVVVPDIGRPRVKRGTAMAFTPELGPMFKHPDVTTGYDLFMMKENEEDLDELTRLFYVATTRAADYLILSAAMEDPDECGGPWMELVARRFDLMTGSRRTIASSGGPSVGGDSSRRSKASTESTSADASCNATVTMKRPAIQSKPVDLRRRRDLMKIVEKAGQMAHDGSGIRPKYLAPVPRDSAARTQYSFSRLRGTLETRMPDAPWSAIDAEAPSASPLDARELGTLVHAVLAQVDFARPDDARLVVQRHADDHLPPGSPEAEVAAEMIERFLRSARAAEIANASRVYREVEFLLAWPPASQAHDGLHLQGFIDCLYCNAAGQWKLIDFKTNRVLEEELEATSAKYELQMFVYALAAERVLKTPPTELALCFLRPGLEFRFPWDAASRRRAVEQVNCALANLQTGAVSLGSQLVT